MPFCGVNARVMTDLEECASYIFVAAAAQTKNESIFTIWRQVAGLHDWYRHKLDKHGGSQGTLTSELHLAFHINKNKNTESATVSVCRFIWVNNTLIKDGWMAASRWSVGWSLTAASRS